MSTIVPSVPRAFEQAIERFRSSLDNEDRARFFQQTQITAEDLEREISHLQHTQRNRSAMRGLVRLKPFVDGMKQYAAVIEVFVQVKPEIMGLIWGPIKFLLQVLFTLQSIILLAYINLEISSEFDQSFDKLLDALQSIGEVLPQFKRFSSIFDYSERIQTVISLVYEDVMEFYRRVFKFFRKRAWTMVFLLLWKNFDSRFKMLLENLKRHKALVVTEVQAEHIEQAFIARNHTQEAIGLMERERTQRQLESLRNWLNPVAMDDYQERYSSLRCESTAQWIFDKPEMKDLKQGKCFALWISGIPGSGKTILCSSVVGHVQNLVGPSPIVAVTYFFCDSKRSHSNTCLAVLRTLLHQLILAMKEELLPFAYEESIKGSISVSRLKKLLSELIPSAVSHSQHVLMVLDGIDELPITERKDLLDILPVFRKQPLSDMVRMVICSRDIPDIRKVLKNDIEKYISAEADNVAETLAEDVGDAKAKEIALEIRDSMSARAKGMFLWCRLVFHNIRSKTTIKELRETLEDLPDDLKTLYKRIIEDLPDKAQARRVFQLVAFSMRPLEVREIMDFLAISPGDSTIDDEKRMLSSKLRDICGPILETSADDYLGLIHSTAKEYLTMTNSGPSGPFISEMRAHLDITQVCTTYLGFRCFDDEISKSESLTFIANGDLKIYHYVRAYWIKHVERFIDLALPTHAAQDLACLSKMLEKLHSKRHASHQAALTGNQTITIPSWFAELQALNLFDLVILEWLAHISDYENNLRKKAVVLTCEQSLAYCIENNPVRFEKNAAKLWSMLEDLLNGRSPGNA